VELAQRTRVVVVGDRVIRARAAGATADHPAEYLQFWPTLDDLFARIRSASEASGVDRITARYDRILGFPAFLSIDYDSSIQDAGATYQVSDVRLIGGTGPLPVRPD
jgi:hypothetical protein